MERLERLGAPNDTGSALGKRNVRGRSRGIDLDDWTAKYGKLPIKFSNIAGEPISTNRCKLSTECGIIVCDFAPRQYASWKKIPENDRVVLIERVKDKFELDITRPAIKKYLNDCMARRYNNYRTQMSAHFKICKTIEEARSKPFENVSLENWFWLCDHFSSGKFKKRSVVGSNNRKHVKYNHFGGSREFQVRLKKKKVLGVQAAKIQTFQENHTHIKEGIVAWGTPDENEIYYEVLEKKSKRRRKRRLSDEEIEEHSLQRRTIKSRSAKTRFNR
ncbi:hypothetical protein MKW98_021287 [Papaver atlanticum]|uniref:Transposase n=1 Tax=Papaver atlanticum TaxID=357466 RepID=A0AAD4XIN3_9MAGN|nr:hypothetical protein MKW98_021287 [Papaver atlanticum]